MVVGFTTNYAITTKVVSSNPAHGEVSLIQHCVIKYVSDLRQVYQWFSPGPPVSSVVFSCPPVSSTNKTDHSDTTEILLKVTLNTI